jgi:hypothetical protein
MTEIIKKPLGMTRRLALTLPAALAVAVSTTKAEAIANPDPATAPPLAPPPALPAASVVGPDGLTNWQRDKLAYLERIYDGRDPAIKPMAAVKGVSPKYQRMAIDLDVALAEYRHIVS